MHRITTDRMREEVWPAIGSPWYRSSSSRKHRVPWPLFQKWGYDELSWHLIFVGRVSQMKTTRKIKDRTGDCFHLWLNVRWRGTPQLRQRTSDPPLYCPCSSSRQSNLPNDAAPAGWRREPRLRDNFSYDANAEPQAVEGQICVGMSGNFQLERVQTF